MGHEQASTTLGIYTNTPGEYEAIIRDALDGQHDFSLTSEPDDDGEGGGAPARDRA